MRTYGDARTKENANPLPLFSPVFPFKKKAYNEKGIFMTNSCGGLGILGDEDMGKWLRRIGDMEQADLEFWG